MKISRHHFEQLDSTNNWAKQQANMFDRANLTFVTAEQQTGGRGRLGRSWHSPKGKNIYATFCFFMDPKHQQIGNVSQVMSLVVAELLEEYGFAPKLKWPNDLLLQGKKFAGILTETKLIDEVLFVAVGVGINVNMSSEEAALIDRPITSLFIESGNLLEIEELLQKLSEQFLIELQQFYAKGFAGFILNYRKHMSHEIDGLMSFSDSQKIWKGYYRGIGEDGSLSLQLEDGEIKKFVAGEPL